MYKALTADYEALTGRRSKHSAPINYQSGYLRRATTPAGQRVWPGYARAACQLMVDKFTEKEDTVKAALWSSVPMLTDPTPEGVEVAEWVEPGSDDESE